MHAYMHAYIYNAARAYDVLAFWVQAKCIREATDKAARLELDLNYAKEKLAQEQVRACVCVCVCVRACMCVLCVFVCVWRAGVCV